MLMTYRPSSGAPSSGTSQSRLRPIGSTPRRTSAKAASKGASLVGDASPIRRPSWSSSQYSVASSISTIDAWLSFSRKARMRSASERADFVRISFALRGAPCGARTQLAARIGRLAPSSPTPDRAVRTRLRPELTRPVLPFAQCQSRTRHFAGVPRSTSARTAGQASRVDVKRPRILFEGVSRSEYPTAPSMTMPKPSGELGRFTSVARLKSNSTRSKSASSLFVFMSFALRGAPCGDDAGQPHVSIGRYHDQATVPVRQPDRQGARLVL